MAAAIKEETRGRSGKWKNQRSSKVACEKEQEFALQGKNSLPSSVHAGACVVLDLDRLLLVGTGTVDSPPPCLSDNKENAVLGERKI